MLKYTLYKNIILYLLFCIFFYYLHQLKYYQEGFQIIVNHLLNTQFNKFCDKDLIKILLDYLKIIINFL